MEDLQMIVRCYPEFHFAFMIYQLVRVRCSRFHCPEQLETEGKSDITWKTVKEIIDDHKQANDLASKSSGCCCKAWHFIWQPRENICAAIVAWSHSTSIKAITFGYRAERQEQERNGKRKTQCKSSKEGVHNRLAKLIFRLEKLKNTLQNHKLKIEQRKSEKGGSGGGTRADGFTASGCDGSSCNIDGQITGLGRSGRGPRPLAQAVQHYVTPQPSMFLVHPVQKEGQILAHA